MLGIVCNKLHQWLALTQYCLSMQHQHGESVQQSFHTVKHNCCISEWNNLALWYTCGVTTSRCMQV